MKILICENNKENNKFKLSLEVKVGLLIVAALLLFFGFVALLFNGAQAESTRENNGRACIQFCAQNGMGVREWRPGRCSCTSVGNEEEQGDH
jgi:hypothetical protein